ncbi:DoxX family protein [Halalkalibacter krulwichiae]|uniref:Putative oxidoreductase CatD n=1 Tax=Halalkalibacter krulwichiae TaxID=199441 RepID=A0A1X9ME97_9BACI|nr:DoxX family protein [Halalkalibacter krulwichiae]ARK29861.1 Putative oxidoreductase CatD [Halalkalibacter krulwichiae]
MANRSEIGTLLLRVVLGIVFLAHGSQKFQGGIENIVGWFDSIGLPGGFAYVVAVLEIVGGIALILGLGTRIAAAILGLILAGAIFKVNLALGFIGGYAYDLILLVIAVHLVINGSKQYSLGQFLFKNQESRSTFSKSA